MSAQDLTIRLLKRSINKPVIVKVKGGKVIRGVLVGYDNHLNLLLKDAEWVDADNSVVIGSILLRGDNVILISPS